MNETFFNKSYWACFYFWQTVLQSPNTQQCLDREDNNSLVEFLTTILSEMYEALVLTTFSFLTNYKFQS